MKENRQVPDEFGVALVRYLEKRKMSQTQLAKATGVSDGYISRLLRGERKAPSVPITVSIIKTLGMPTSYLLRVLELEDVDQGNDEVQDIYDLILFSNFTIEGEKVETEIKEILVDILQSIIACKWSKKTIAQDVMVIANSIEELKTQFNA
ncbi:helix-turn-helix domain-containing protein [Fictibacillus phosphorivorans]|uniref:helix-turn-helix domain-containing protein n=1 Tax=Fictibacillus phosphorivorans TaxID=1221500 RepID=UPI0012940209|nr:helix-turn-helix transcriptional regulator [Fictibacillus phosphorivorans]MQR93698.1 XRE family transcriptional regulator [Fictibacillus phosphorivorans]